VKKKVTSGMGEFIARYRKTMDFSEINRALSDGL
jgi:hypothetical protein